jgi:serine/threonine protein kinase
MNAPESLIAGRYRLVTRLAAGGMGSVWRAWDERLRRDVAVKELLHQPGLSEQDAQTANHRLFREARITARLQHPHAVQIYDVVEQDGRPFLIMQYVPSKSLQAMISEQGRLAEPFVARIGAEIASALVAAHHVGIVHRDVKPGNVLITDSGAAKLTDFGVSHAIGDVSLTSTGMVTGTPAYLAPEVARGMDSSFASDVFSLGSTLYAALEGAPPFGTTENPMALLHKVAQAASTRRACAVPLPHFCCGCSRPIR